MQLSLREARDRRGWSLDQVARRSGLHKSTVSRLERGETEPSLRTAEALEVALGLPRGGLLFGPAAVEPRQLELSTEELVP